MSTATALKLVEALVLLAALVLFVWWQMRDLKRAAAETARQRALRENGRDSQPPEAQE